VSVGSIASRRRLRGTVATNSFEVALSAAAAAPHRP
jgi:hypothetical protein